MDKKLEEYRRKKRREWLLTQTKQKFKGFFVSNKRDMDEASVPLYEKDEDPADDVVSNYSDDTSLNCWTYKDLARYAIYLSLWVVGYYFFILYQFGIVYFIMSCLIGMYLNTRTGPKSKSEVSAYSVFNENCHSINGTLKGEQFEREMGYRM